MLAPVARRLAYRRAVASVGFGAAGEVGDPTVGALAPGAGCHGLGLGLAHLAGGHTKAPASEAQPCERTPGGGRTLGHTRGHRVVEALLTGWHRRCPRT